MTLFHSRGRLSANNHFPSRNQFLLCSRHILPCIGEECRIQLPGDVSSETGTCTPPLLCHPRRSRQTPVFFHCWKMQRKCDRLPFSYPSSAKDCEGFRAAV